MILARNLGLKSQTRRLVRITKVYEPDYGKPVLDKAWIDTSYLKKQFGNVPCLKIRFDGNGQKDMETSHRHFPDWEPGDLLWVREAHTITAWKRLPPKFHSVYRLNGFYNADGQKFQLFLSIEESAKFEKRKRKIGSIPPIFMYRSLSRGTDQVTRVRVQRVQDITEKDVTAEGLRCDARGLWAWPGYPGGSSNPIYAYELLWKLIHGEDSWEDNPWVWATEFETAPQPKKRSKRWLDRRLGARR